MLDLKSFLEEALDNKQKKQVDSWKKGDHSFSNHVFGENGHTVYESFVHEQDAAPHPKVAEHLEEHGYKIHHYVKGYAIDKHNRQISIGKVLNKTNADPTVKKAFETDPNRKASQKSNLMIAYTRHPHHVAGMSTGQGWTSCLDMNDGINKHLVHHDINQGTHVAYLIHHDDKEIQHPIARIAMKRYQGKIPKVGIHNVLRPEPRQYGHGSGAFETEVRNWSEKHFPLHPKIMKYEMHRGPYTDGSGTLIPNTTEALQHAIKKDDTDAVHQLVQHKHHALYLINNHKEDLHDNCDISESIIHHHPDLIHHFLDHPNPYMHTSIIHAAPKHAENFLQTNNSDVKRAIIRKRPDLAHHFYEDKNEYVQATIAQLGGKHADHFMAGEFHKRHPIVREALASHKHLSHFFYNDPDHDVRMAVTQHKEHAKHLINDPHALVRKEIMFNYPDLAHHFKRDDNSQVRSVALHILNLDPNKNH